MRCQLKRLPPQSSPGPDGIPYNVWKSSDTSTELLARIYSTCCRIPSTWKTSNKVLIYTKGDKSQPRNWRPISLQPTIHKIYAAILARRLALLAVSNKTISQSQTGFLPFEGCAEHSFLLRSVFEDSKRRNKNVRVVWLDLKNAFGSVPHDTMWEMMKRLDFTAHFTSICQEIYQNSTQRVRSAEGLTHPILVRRGIKPVKPTTLYWRGFSPIWSELKMATVLEEEQ